MCPESPRKTALPRPRAAARGIRKLAYDARCVRADGPERRPNAARQTKHLDRWDASGARFIFVIDAMNNLKQTADSLDSAVWRPLRRKPKYTVRTQRRRRPRNVKEQIVVEREYKNIRLCSEDVAEFAYRPTACKKTYRIVVIRQNLSVARGESRLFDDIRYFFYITNDSRKSAAETVFSANQRCNQENLNDQLRNGVRALRMPTDNLVSKFCKVDSSGKTFARNRATWAVRQGVRRSCKPRTARLPCESRRSPPPRPRQGDELRPALRAHRPPTNRKLQTARLLNGTRAKPAPGKRRLIGDAGRTAYGLRPAHERPRGKCVLPEDASPIIIK